MDVAWHLIAVYISLVIPVSGFLEQRRLKRMTSQASKEQAYLILHGVYWIAALPVLLIDPTVYRVRHSLELGWMGHTLLSAALAYLLIVTVVPLILLRYNGDLRKEVAKSYEKRRHTFPTTERQHKLFVWVSITVGITEEILYRGFLYNYGVEHWGLSSLASAVTVSLVFGLIHFSQGLAGIFSSFVFGAVMAWLYFITGSLLLPVILHILYDLKIIGVQKILNNKNTQSEYAPDVL
ncbi:CPBP family intramembrane glutamic endopeptidase [Paenibacillus lutrae]|uniref:CPBP family intramembrane metalloprotease n=1 Tax=Paenibacillus lutrae TaxID=2078573 RepID=A0A7X3FGG4_9BACL|nr:CPBP family intramembrane glutamic endopeptidase [Paenibacillus lutrae]MVO99325.1 CPBP family intramembrane metalloprotease [Paenibacillus lutrae]